jgi:hypothetical protein
VRLVTEEGKSLTEVATHLGIARSLLVRKHRHAGFPIQFCGVKLFEYATVHIITTATLRRLREVYPAGQITIQRFRPNIVVDCMDETGFAENSWPGRSQVFRRISRRRKCENSSRQSRTRANELYSRWLTPTACGLDKSCFSIVTTSTSTEVASASDASRARR